MSALRLAAAAALVCLAACHDGDYLSYGWDDRDVLCSDAIDDITGSSQEALVENELEFAHDNQRVALFHAHKPGVTVTYAMIERTLELADQWGLDYVTYDELVAGPKRGGLALAFDDDDVAGWLTLRDTFAAHHARVTFFVTRYYKMDDATLGELETLAADGHDLEPHSVNHQHVPAYLADHGVDGYMTDEALPSMQVLAAAGHPPTSYAYPFGQHTAELDHAVLQHVQRVRVSPGSCPW
jgi:hypothetical protein